MTFINPAGKLLGHLDRLAELQATGRTATPINLECDLSNRCSLGCEWCHFSYTHSSGPLKGAAKPEGAVSGGDLMETRLALDLIDQAAQLGVRSITWTGGGEPTLHPHFDAIVDHDLLPQGLYTHGGHISEARAALLKRRMTFVFVSLDAVDAASYKRHKGVDRFQAACDGIRRLAAAEGPAKVGLGMLVGPDTPLEDVPKAAVLAAELGADYVQFRPIIAFDVNDPGVPVGDRSWVRPMMAAVEKCGGNVEADLGRFRHYAEWTGHGYGTCRWSMLQTCVTPDGSVWVCVNRREFSGSKIGSLAEESLAEVWARHTAVQVDGSCRVSCRGDVANRALEEILAPAEHAAFV